MKVNDQDQGYDMRDVPNGAQIWEQRLYPDAEKVFRKQEITFGWIHHTLENPQYPQYPFSGREEWSLCEGNTDDEATTKRYPSTQGDKGWYENDVQLVQWISSVYKSANDRYMETCLVQWISSEIKLRKRHCTGRNPKPYAGAYYIMRMNKGNGNIDENPDITPLSMHGVSTCDFNSSSHRPALSTIWCVPWTSSIMKGGSRFVPGYPPVHGRGWGIFPHMVEALLGAPRNCLGTFSLLPHW